MTTLIDEPRAVEAIYSVLAELVRETQPIGYGVSINESAMRLRAQLIYDGLKAIADADADRSCPHAAPFRYCARCPVQPCPLGMPQPEPKPSPRGSGSE